MNRHLDLIAPLLAVFALLCAATHLLPVWLPALAALGSAPWQVFAGGRVFPAAVAAAAMVMLLLWTYGVLAFLLILLAVVGVASLLRWEGVGPR